MTTPSRRAVMAGASTLAIGTAANVAAICTTRAAEVDPIFAAIERHRALYIQQMASASVRFELKEGTPEHDAVCAIHRAEFEVSEGAGVDLTRITPTTLAGVLALLAYVEEFNDGGVVLPSDATHWFSTPDGWPVDFAISIGNDDDDVDPFPWLLMRNVANALRSIEAVQS